MVVHHTSVAVWKMELTVDQVLMLAPDASSAASGKKLSKPGPWKNLGRTTAAVWGECQGSAVYQVRVDLSAFGYKCSCPSRKLPCKHVLGLLLLASGAPGSLREAEPPEWVSQWLSARVARGQKAETKQAEASKAADPAAQAKRVEQRHQRICEGLDRLDLWLNDLVRNGLAGLELQPPSFWEKQARRLVDAQAPGLAARMRHIGELPGSRPEWPQHVLQELGRLALLTHAYRRVDQFDPGLQAEVRQLVGWTIRQEELGEIGETVADEWLILGQTAEPEERVTVQRNWLLGARTGRTALVLQFSSAGQPYPESIVPGLRQEADLVFWPGADPQRARFAARRGESRRIEDALPGAATIEKFLDRCADVLSRQPWLDRTLCVLRDVVPISRGGAPWLIRDRAGGALPLAPRGQWKLLALCGGAPVDLAAEWNGESLAPLGVLADGAYHLLGVDD